MRSRAERAPAEFVPGAGFKLAAGERGNKGDKSTCGSKSVRERAALLALAVDILVGLAGLCVCVWLWLWLCVCI